MQGLGKMRSADCADIAELLSHDEVDTDRLEQAAMDAVDAVAVRSVLGDVAVDL